MPSTHDYRSLFIGLDVQTPLLNGSCRCYSNFDNAASTPPLKAVQNSVDDFLVFYSSVHRGTGFKSQLSTHAYERARHITLDFVGADLNEHTCIFGKNTTEAVNKLARRFPFTAQRDVVLTSGMEHHSNDLPWRTVAHTVHVALTPDGRLDEADFDAQLERYGERVALVAITGASNVTGFLNPVHRLAEKTHAVGAMIMVDCAQFAPHRKVDMRRLADPSHFDFITISAHKMYAPFGTGALIGRMDVFSQGDPDLTGGGTVEIVTLEDVVYTTPPDRDEAGSPNTVGAIALAAAIRQLEAVGMDQVAQHEAELTEYALRRLPSVPGLRLYGDGDPAHASQRLGVIPLMLESAPHFLASAILGYEFGIGVRSGCFCAHPYILHLLGLSHAESRQVRSDMLAGDKSHMPGLIRASFGLYNTLEEVDYLVEALNRIARGDYQGRYTQEKATGEYQPVGWAPQFEEYFKL
jgi:selenocysteine lyase/cysteine desulfurase